jgi:flagellar hook-associated protein 1 FlgK
LRQSVEERRQSVSAVSLDEEMMNMIKFQHAYNAAARQITAIDEMLDKIINGMGVVGR